MRARVLIADDHKIFQDGLRALLEQTPGMIVVACAGNGRDAVGLARELRPDVVLMDVSMPEMNGIEATRQILADTAGVKVIGLSMYSDRRIVREMLRAGAAGYLLKESAFEELVLAIQTVVEDEIYLSPKINTVLIKDYLRWLSAPASEEAPSLTPREQEVLQLLAEGNRTREIAQRIHVSVKTVETHRRQIMEKLGLYSVAALTKYAVQQGLTSPEP